MSRIFLRAPSLSVYAMAARAAAGRDAAACFGRQRLLQWAASIRAMVKQGVRVFITAVAVPITKLFAWGEGDSGGHVLRETTSRGLSGLVCPSRS